MNDTDKHYQAILRLHDKMDNQIKQINDLSVDVAKLPIGVIFTRLRIVEKVVYGAVIIILVAFMVTLTDSPKKVTASPTILHKVQR